MTDSALVFVTAIPDPADQPAMQEYLQRVLPLLMAAGGKLLGRGMVQHVVVGTADFKMAMVMSFESVDAAQAVFEADNYQALKPVRDRGFKQINIAIAASL